MECDFSAIEPDSIEECQDPQTVDDRPDDDDDPQDDQQRQEHEFWIAGVLARYYERLGLIPEPDQFDWEWHQEMDGEMEAVRENKLPLKLRKATVLRTLQILARIPGLIQIPDLSHIRDPIWPPRPAPAPRETSGHSTLTSTSSSIVWTNLGSQNHFTRRRSSGPTG